MRICKLEINNFRGVRSGAVVFPQHGTLLGPNNVGKSTITEALALVFGRERMSRAISDWDFFGGSPQPESRFKIIATITDFGDSNETDPDMFPEWFHGERAARPVWWHPKTSKLTFETDPPEGSQLAAQIALAARFDEDTSEFETIRFFYSPDCDPFTEDHQRVPFARLTDLGLFVLPSNRQWDKQLAFASSTFLKVLRQSDAMPGQAIERLKRELRSEAVGIGDDTDLKALLETAEVELRSLLLLDSAGQIRYRPTSLDTTAVLQSLVPHIIYRDDFLLPVARHGSGMVSLQSFLLLLAFANYRKKAGQNFILVAEEPELHLHPSLHRRLANRIRSVSTQSIVTTHSALVAATYQPTEALFLQNKLGDLTCNALREESVKSISKNSVRNLYLRHREAMYEALMGGSVLVPEGLYDHQWLLLWQRVVEATSETTASSHPLPITIIPTSDSAVVETAKEVMRFRDDAIPLLDGDDPGEQYLTNFRTLKQPPKNAVRFGENAAIECLSAWILEPSLASPGPTLSELLPKEQQANLKMLQDSLSKTENKKDVDLRENLVWEAHQNKACIERAREFLSDISKIGAGQAPANPDWRVDKTSKGMTVHVATHISKC